jgi:glycosyltransferase involved in cell wall biosynthesis
MSKGISLIFPVFKDERTVRIVAEKALRLLKSAAEEYEVIIINDGSPDRSGEIADELSRQHSCIRVIHHQVNLGYGRAIRSGLSACRYDSICMIDGDDQYEVSDFLKLLKFRDCYDLIITFRYKKIYSSARLFISWVYNKMLRILFRTPFRDVSTGIRLARKVLIDDVHLESNSPFIGAELAIKAMLKGYRVGEVGIQTFPREFGRGSSTSVKNIIATMREMWRTYRNIFSDEYDLPTNRNRSSMSK